MATPVTMNRFSSATTVSSTPIICEMLMPPLVDDATADDATEEDAIVDDCTRP